jgi:SAM-dependent methyltransferase
MAHEDLKERQSVMWGTGAFDEVADSIGDVHRTVIERLSPAPGDRYLDIACGTGRVCELAASAGATVVGIDLAPGLIEVAKQRAAERGLSIDYRVGDAENLDVEDASFDEVSSTFGLMFAPTQEAAASELARVTRPGGRIALANWTPEGRIGEMFRITGSFQPAPPPSVPVRWGTEERCRELLGDAFDLQFERRLSTWEWESGEAMWDFMSQRFGPMVTLLGVLPPDRAEDFHQAMVAFGETGRQGDRIVDEREYLLVLGTRR